MAPDVMALMSGRISVLLYKTRPPGGIRTNAVYIFTITTNTNTDKTRMRRRLADIDADRV
jgi:hypothetical protein